MPQEFDAAAALGNEVVGDVGGVRAMDHQGVGEVDEAHTFNAERVIVRLDQNSGLAVARDVGLGTADSVDAEVPELDGIQAPHRRGAAAAGQRKASLFPSVFLTRIWLAPGSVSTHCEELLSSRMASERNPCPEPLI